MVWSVMRPPIVPGLSLSEGYGGSTEDGESCEERNERAGQSLTDASHHTLSPVERGLPRKSGRVWSRAAYRGPRRRTRSPQPFLS